MNLPMSRRSRRAFLGTVAASAAFFSVKGAFADDHVTPAVGEITQLSGRILGPSGSPLRDVTVEIWQCDAHEVYLHSADSEGKKAQQDPNFQGFGRFTTGSTGEYRFRTIKPVPYPGRPAPHIHVKLKRGERELLTTQLNIAGHPGNKQDGIAMEGTLFERELLQTEFTPIPGSKVGELAAKWDIVLGRTPDERTRRTSR
jgi:protocatechuate 3,4-dioxygenase beta subunit